MERLLERVPPSTVLAVLVAGPGTFIGGLTFALYFMLAYGFFALGHYLDFYGIKRD